MINHILHYFEDGFTYTWTMQLPFRLIQGDLIHSELVLYKGKLVYDKEVSDEWIKFSFDHEHFEVEYVLIDQNANVVAVMMLPTKGGTEDGNSCVEKGARD